MRMTKAYGHRIQLVLPNVALDSPDGPSNDMWDRVSKLLSARVYVCARHTLCTTGGAQLQPLTPPTPPNPTPLKIAKMFKPPPL